MIIYTLYGRPFIYHSGILFPVSGSEEGWSLTERNRLEPFLTRHQANRTILLSWTYDHVNEPSKSNQESLKVVKRYKTKHEAYMFILEEACNYRRNRT